MGFREILQEHDGRRGQKVPLPEGVADKDTEDFTAFDIGHAGGKAMGRAYDRPFTGTFKKAGGRNARLSRRRRRFQKVPEFASDEELESRPGAVGKRLEYL